MAYTLPPLPYAFDALEPYIDTLTMELHHDGHHAAYVANLNKALEKYPELAQKPVITLLKELDTLPADIKTAVRNNGGGHYNHSLFWLMMTKNGGGEPVGSLATEIKKQFKDFKLFQDQFNATAKTVFGSGWAWLVVDQQGKLAIMPTANQDSPISKGLIPVLGLDVWEHAYYVKYHNKRPDYINAWWHVIDWDQIEENYRNAIL
ncbi:MAG: superoxide dismutase [Candidatus Babeliales bacterium]